MFSSLQLHSINLREMEEELDYRENEHRTSRFDPRPWLIPALLFCSATILLMR